MKVRSLRVSRSTARVLAAASLAAVLAAGGAAAPIVAWAQSSASPVTPTASVQATATPVASATTTTSPAVVTTPTAPAPAKKLTVPELITKVGHDSKLSAQQIAALLWIAKHESNFHPTSKSSSGCYGLFQLSASMVRGQPWKDATWNTKRAIKYMKGRYGGPVQAKAFWTAHHWY